MKLNDTQLKKIIHGNLAVNNYDGIQLNRFLPKQYDAYKDEYIEWIIRTQASAGIVIDFISDTNYFKMEFEFKKGSSRDFGCFDIYVDDIMIDHKHFSIDECLLGFKLDGKKHRITIYLPWSFEVIIKNIYIQDGAYIKQIKKKHKVLCLGDSITQGYISEYPSLTYPAMIYRYLDTEVINQGIGGYYFNKESLCEELKNYNFDLITVAYGTNDYTRDEEKKEFIYMAESYLDKLITIFPKKKIMGIIPIHRASNDYHTKVRELNRNYSFEESKDILKSIYKKKGLSTIDEIYIPHCNEFFAPDGVHPNELGFLFYGSTVTQIVAKYLEK